MDTTNRAADPVTTDNIGREENQTLESAVAETAAAAMPPTVEDAEAKRRKDLFGDCALVEIIHLHDCLRGALKALENDVNDLNRVAGGGVLNDQLEDLERRVAGRHKVIWSVFRAHSSAEDEFIWPALQSKTQGKVRHRCGGSKQRAAAGEAGVSACGGQSGDEYELIGQEEYEEDHNTEEQMFSDMDSLLGQLRAVLLRHKQQSTQQHQQQKQESQQAGDTNPDTIHGVARSLSQHTKKLSQHLHSHLAKEENQCMPLVVKHLSRSEIHELVGKIMGKRSSDLIAQIMTMAVQNLPKEEREEMVKFMRQAMEGTFFDRWLSMSGWGNNKFTGSNGPEATTIQHQQPSTIADNNADGPSGKRSAAQALESESDGIDQDGHNCKRANVGDAISPDHLLTTSIGREAADVTSQAELEKLIRAVASNPALTPIQKNTTIQGLRDSVWKSNQRQKESSLEQQQPSSHAFAPQAAISASSSDGGSMAANAAGIRIRRATPPSMYLRKNDEGKVEFVWSSESPISRCPTDGSVPLFSAAELAPTFHDGAAGAVLGCPHYARACKLRHPKSGRLYSCRLCCEQQRDMPMKDQDEPLDRYAVTEVMCMKCNALQPADDRCMNPTCESYGKPFAKYFCRICHLYDDRSRPIFHCPYCNTCRMGLGLGIDFRHCMRCNACVSLADDDHRCIPQKLQGSCPICHDSMFSSTEPLRGLKCGHVMHLSCFSSYRRGHSYTCPLCQRSMEDMKDHFALLDAAVRMQPMPACYLNTVSNIYCQDCGKTGQCQYHFVGQKCPHCGSYNTREMGRVQNAPAQAT